MKNDLDRDHGKAPDDQSNVVSLKDARTRAAEKARDRSAKAKPGRGDGDARISLGQWIVGALFMLMAIGGAVALVKPLTKGAGLVGGWGIG